MKLFGLDISIKKALQSVPSRGWFSVLESNTGSWQRGETIEASTALTHSAVYACVNLISSDIAKLPIQIAERKTSYWAPVPHQYDALLRKPNAYQNRSQFISNWMASKFLHGNTYVLKQRDGMGRVSALHVIDPKRVQALISDDGAVFYRISNDDRLSNTSNVTVPAREIIHDRGLCPFHPLVGVSPLTAASLAANQALSIQSGSAKFFGNGSTPGGVISAPGQITAEVAKELQDAWQLAHAGDNLGRVAILPEGLKYEPYALSAIDSQLLEQLNFSAQDVARAFQIPAWKINAGPSAPYTSSEATNLQYLADCLQAHIESLELCLDDGLELPPTQRTELDESSLLRLDSKTRTEVLSSKVKAGLLTINEARASEGKAPVAGGDEIMRQMQDIPLGAPQT